MPINIPNKLPAAKVLTEENIFFLREKQATHQDIRPLEILIMNLMPEKITTETQILRLIGNTPIQTEITLIHPKTHDCTHTKKDHLLTFYKHFDDIKEKKFDGLIITGAPVEQFKFEDVDYWDELKELMEWSKKNVTSTLHICWASQAGLYYHYNIKKYPLKEKMFGIFPHKKNKKHPKLLRGFDDIFYVPQSRHTTVKKEEINKIKNLEILSESKDAGIYAVVSSNGSQIFVTGHSEYDPLSLKDEYLRDLAKNKSTNVPKNYFKNDNPKNDPIVNWKGHANLLFCNWINYYVYQESSFQ